MSRFRSKIFIISLCLLASFKSFSQDSDQQALTYSDELVTNLSCQQISAASILAAIDPQKAFMADRHIPVRNWSFSVGFYDIANCWSLSRSQRLLFYLGRNQITPSQVALKQSLAMIRKYTPAGVYNYTHVVPWNTDWFKVLVKGYQEVVNGNSYNRTFKNDIEAYQDRRFHDIDNATYLEGERERSPKENMKTMSILGPNVKAKKLSLLILRPARSSQHVVMPKYSITRPTGEVDFFIYDSNIPQRDVVVTYNPKTQHFYAPEIVGYFHLPRPNDPIGVFLVDEADRDPILSTLVKYYTQTCEAQTWAKN